MQGDFTRTARWSQALDPARLSAFVLDDEALAERSPHVRDIAVVGPTRAWTARLVSHMGRFDFAAPVEVRVRAQAPQEYVEIEATGKDPRMGTRLRVEAHLEVGAGPEPGGTGERGVAEARLTGHYAVRGRVANLAPGVVHRHAGLMVDAFWERFVWHAAGAAGARRS